jgi:alkanesulfonate monooxygenase SsuD/methylene tetrahydromethanopterin reductase-like flavin-dependent oxidoreductase (luciferase family)
MVALSHLLSAIMPRFEIRGLVRLILRPPVLLAKMIATLDQLSKGRVDLGVGTGWQREEYEALGIPFENRIQRLEDQLRACRVLWSECPASFTSDTVSFSDVYCRPAPYQKNGIPIWFGLAANEVNCRRIAELGAGWVPIERDLQKVSEGVSAIRSAFIDAGRNPDDLQVTGSVDFGKNGLPDAKTFAQLEEAVDVGITHVTVAPAFAVNSAEEIPLLLKNAAKLKGV